MYVVIADLKLKNGMESEFKDWVIKSNKDLSKFDGFVNRRLLESLAGSYRMIVEFNSKENFEKMHQTKEHAKIQAQGLVYMDGFPKPSFYHVVSQ